jgi:hypothetical protein
MTGGRRLPELVRSAQGEGRKCEGFHPRPGIRTANARFVEPTNERIAPCHSGRPLVIRLFISPFSEAFVKPPEAIHLSVGR